METWCKKCKRFQSHEVLEVLEPKDTAHKPYLMVAVGKCPNCGEALAHGLWVPDLDEILSGTEATGAAATYNRIQLIKGPQLVRGYNDFAQG